MTFEQIESVFEHRSVDRHRAEGEARRHDVRVFMPPSTRGYTCGVCGAWFPTSVESGWHYGRSHRRVQ